MVTLTQLQKKIVRCTQCPRLVTYWKEVAVNKVRRFQDHDYWGKPVPSFGDPCARLLLIGLAPAAHGGNRTGRAFTGDRSGKWLYDALHRYGFANQPTSEHRGDGLALRDCYIAQVLHCAPPANKPTRQAILQCEPYLQSELALLPRLRVIMPLGKIAFDACLRACRELAYPLPTPTSRFAHGVSYPLDNGITLLPSYHPSQQNTQTGRLTREMFHQVFAQAQAHVSAGGADDLAPHQKTLDKEAKNHLECGTPKKPCNRLCGTHGLGGDMSFSRPRSFLQLVLLGFVLVMLPLIIATINATLSVDRLANQSQQAVQNAAQVTKHSEEIAEHLIHMERAARQYHVLGDADLFVAYRTAHEQFALMTSDLARLPLNDYQQRQLQILIEKESFVFESLRGSTQEDEGTDNKGSAPQNKETGTGSPPVDVKAAKEPSPEDVKAEEALAEFQSLVPFSEMIRLASEQVVNRQAASMQQAAQKSKQMLVWQVLAVIPGTVVFALIFVALISRPIRQIRQATLQLGEGDFSSQITVTGSRDLENLGQSLDWLRVHLQELEDAKRQFLGKVSHELKTPLAAIREGVSLMADGIVGEINPSQKEIVGILQEKSHHLQELLENLVNFSMAHARQATVMRQPVRLHEIVEDVAMDHKPGMLAKTIQLDMDAAEVVVMGDDEKLRTVMDNLFSNAVKYSPDGGKIHVTLQSRDAHAVLDVADDGPGVPDTERDKIFDPFYQGGASPAGYLKGNGLGLAIAREYLTGHHGTIQVIDHPGSGAHFRVRLPLQ